MNYLLEDRRNDLVAQGKRGEREKIDGKTRYEKRVKSRIASTVKEYNQIDMQSLYKYNILTVQVPVVGETDNYLVRIKFGSFLDVLKDQINRQNGKLDLRAVTRALLEAFNRDDVYIYCNCLHPSTKIKLLDGTSPTIEEMKLRFDKGEKLYVYSADENGDFKPGEVEKVWITQTTFNFIKIILDNDKELITTPDHPYMLRDGTYEQAQNLNIGQSLMSLYTSDVRYNHKVKNIEYITLPNTPVYDIKVKDWHNFATEAGVYLHNCPDWKYRMGFWASMSKINSGPPERRPSKITNPRNSLGPGCKHVMLVLANSSWLIKVASVIWNYINYMEKHQKKLYADLMYPAIYGKKYEEPIQLSIEDEEELADTIGNDTSKIDVANIEGRTRGQFKPGNKYRFKPNERPGTKDQISIEEIETEEN